MDMFWIGFVVGMAVAVTTPCLVMLAGELVHRLRRF